MRIRCLMDFKEGRDAFYKDDIRTLDDAIALRLIGNGWAVKEGDSPTQVDTPASVTLEVHDAYIGVEDKSHG